ncbi:MAG TPA: hypothetical protein PLZ36_12325, partial [Armatimonadota bacterium]|nr:hypothetical protein [Armatimonadota bacterium]
MRKLSPLLLLVVALAAHAAPTDFPGLALWLRADAGVTLDETGHVSAWLDADRDNGFIQEAAESRPSLAENVVNGHPALRFDGPNGYMRLTQPIKASDGAVFLVARWDQKCLDGSARYLLGNDTGTNGYLISDGRGKVIGSGGARHYQNGVRVLPGHVGADPRIFPLANAPLHACNIITIIGDTRPNLLLAYLGQNGQNRSRSPFLGDVAEMLVFTQPLTAAQVRAVESYLGGKYFNWPAPKTVAIAHTAAEMRALAMQAQPSPGWDAVSPARVPHGVLWTGSGRQPLAPGRYRLHVSLTLPRGVPHLRVLARVNNTVRVISPREQGGGASTAFTLDFTQDAARAAELPLVRLSWTTDPDPDALDPAQRGDTLAGAVRLTPLREIAANPGLLAAGEPRIERLCPIAITGVTADKVRYAPGEKGRLSVQVLNLGADVTGEVTAKLLRNVADVEIILPAAPLALKAGAAHTLDVPFTARGRWGAGARVTVTADGLRESADEAFTVSDNPFEAGLGVDFGSALHTGLKRYPAAIARARARYATWLDLPGWSPGECA